MRRDRFGILYRNNYDETLIICIKLIESLFIVDNFKGFKPNLFEPLTHNRDKINKNN